MISPTDIFHPPPTPHFKSFQVLGEEEEKKNLVPDRNGTSGHPLAA